MPISGWVLTLTEEAALREATIAALRADPRLTLGELNGLKLPVVLDTLSVAEDRALVEALRELEGVTLLNLVFLDFADAEASEGGWPASERRHRPEVAQDALEV